MISQIKFNNLKSYDDYNLIILNVEISYPTPKLIKGSVPFQNGEYDFTGLYGGTPFNNRRIAITFEYRGDTGFSRTNLNVYYTDVVNWLYGANENRLYIDHEQGYFIGRVINITPIEILNYSGKITVEFDCYPFRTNELAEGSDIWDEFNFELDYSIETKFNVNGTFSIDLYNSSIINKTPEVICSSKFEIIKNGITYNFMPGTYKDYRFVLNKGNNHMTIKGTGNIEFKFYKEVI